ncbi:MAG: permease [Planctomycetota bacterium]
MLFELPTFETLAVTFIVTAVRTILEASPTLLGGALLAAYVRTQIEPSHLEKIFPGSGSRGVLRAALIGMTLPVCSLGILPVLRELQRLGLATSKLITLCVVAPLLNPFTILYGLSVLSTMQCLMVLAVVGIVVVTVGDVSARFATREEVTAAPRPAGLTGGTRLRNLLIASGRVVAGRMAMDVALTVLVTTLSVAWIRDGALYEVCDGSNAAGPGIVAFLTFPQYVSPSRGIIQFAGIENANLSVVTGLSLYVFGTGIGFASVLALARWYGWRRLMALLIALCLIMGVVTVSLRFILPAPMGAIEETSALDGLTRPVYSSLTRLGMALQESLSFVDPFMILSSVAVLGLFVTGLVVRWSRIELRDDDPEIAARENAKRMSKAIPPSQLGAIAVVGIAILLCLFTYVMFPSPGEFFDEMETIQLDANIAIRSGKVELAIDRIVAWDASASKLPIGAAIRGSFPTSVQREMTRELRTELHRTRAFLQSGDLAAAQDNIRSLTQLLFETKVTFDKGAS